MHKSARDTIALLRGDASFSKIYSKEDWLSFLLYLNKAGLLTRCIGKLVPIAPSFIRKVLKKSWTNHVAEMKGRLEALESFTAVARVSNLKFAVIRGMSSSVKLYGDAFRRSSDDIDIMVAPDDIAKADYVAREAGWIQPGEAFKIRNSLAKGIVDLELLESSVAPFSLRSSNFLPHVTNYYYPNSMGRIVPLALHDRLYGLESKNTEGLLWQTNRITIGAKKYPSCSDETEFVIAALSLFANGEGVRTNTSRYRGLGLKSALDVHLWLRKLRATGALEKARSLIETLDVRWQVGSALGASCDVWREDENLAIQVGDLFSTRWRDGYVSRVLDRSNAASRAVAQVTETVHGGLDKKRFLKWFFKEKMPWREICSVNGLLDTSFRFRYVMDEKNVIASWELPMGVLSEIDLGLQLLLVGLSGCDQPVLCRVHVFREGAKWHAALLKVREDNVDGHMCAVSGGASCTVTVRPDASGGSVIALKAPFSGYMSAVRAAVPSVYSRVYGRVYRCVAGIDLPDLVDELFLEDSEAEAVQKG